MKAKHRKTLLLIYKHPVSGNIKWLDIESLFKALGAEITEHEGSRVGVFLFGKIRVFHRPHPSPCTDKGAIASIRNWLKEALIKLLEILRDFKVADSRRALQAMASPCQKAQQRSCPLKAPPEGG